MRSGVYTLYFPVFALRKGALVEFVLTLQMFNEQATTAAGCMALIKTTTQDVHVFLRGSGPACVVNMGQLILKTVLWGFLLFSRFTIKKKRIWLKVTQNAATDGNYNHSDWIKSLTFLLNPLCFCLFVQNKITVCIVKKKADSTIGNLFKPMESHSQDSMLKLNILTMSLDLAGLVTVGRVCDRNALVITHHYFETIFPQNYYLLSFVNLKPS